tara:strand:- start:3573 stop:3821 length:249 start_codon:yes stop_codon:yes gene_type:complete
MSNYFTLWRQYLAAERALDEADEAFGKAEKAYVDFLLQQEPIIIPKSEGWVKVITYTPGRVHKTTVKDQRLTLPEKKGEQSE